MKIRTFPRGIHPPGMKSFSKDKSFEIMPPPEKVIISLHQHFGAQAQPIVKKGDYVFLGQKIGKAPTLFSANVHSSVSGNILAIDNYIHPLGGTIPAVVIKNDGEDKLSGKSTSCKKPFSLTTDQLRKKIKEAGIVGMGGAAFPTAVKIAPPKDKPIDTVVLNGCECEPILTADHRLMLEYPDEILKGAALVCKATGAKKLIVGIENNKKDAYKALKNHLPDIETKIVLLKTKYPQGAEKNLIYALTKKEVPRGGLPFDVGIVVQNVATAKAVWDAISQGKPLIERPLTVSGPCIKEPKNLIVRIGTPFENVVNYCGGLNSEYDTLIMGGPMMGLSQWSLETPVIKGTSGLLALKTGSLPKEFNCISCSRCIGHCPMGLVPTQLMKQAKHESFEDAEKDGILDCVECGSCQFICPANIPLVHWIRLGKNIITRTKRTKSA